MDLKRYLEHKATGIGLVIITFFLSQAYIFIGWHNIVNIETMSLYRVIYALVWLVLWMLVLLWGIKFKSKGIITLYLLFWAGGFIFLFLFINKLWFDFYAGSLGGILIGIGMLLWYIPVGGITYILPPLRYISTIADILLIVVPAIMLAIGLAAIGLALKRQHSKQTTL